ncbi:Uncharacterised protein [uncultured archaeon]|nr:Uncharacterised protein [uncultured archaeon]
MRQVKKQSKIGVLRTVFTSPSYLAVAAASAVFYYFLFFYMIEYSNRGLFLLTVPIYLMYALIATGAVLLTVSAYAITRSIRMAPVGASGSVLSVFTSSFGCMVAGCGCYAPVLSSILYIIGFGSFQVSGAIALMGNYQVEFIALLIIINLAFIYYQTSRITRIGRLSRR